MAGLIFEKLSEVKPLDEDDQADLVPCNERGVEHQRDLEDAWCYDNLSDEDLSAKYVQMLGGLEHVNSYFFAMVEAAAVEELRDDDVPVTAEEERAVQSPTSPVPSPQASPIPQEDLEEEDLFEGLRSPVVEDARADEEMSEASIGPQGPVDEDQAMYLSLSWGELLL